MKEEEMAKEYSKSACAWIEDREPLDERDIQQAFLAGLKAGKKNANEGEIYELRMKIAELQELLTDCLFYCNHVDPYYIDCLKEDEIFERAEKLGVKYNV